MSATPEKPVHEQVRDELERLNPEALTADGLDEALIGVLVRPGRPAVACYDRGKCLDILEQDMEGEDAAGEALEYFEFNVIGAYVGESTPVFADIRWDR